jgi:hypothetical protein
MSAVKHTPGPWELEGDVEWVMDDAGGHRHLIIRAPDGWNVALVQADEDDEEQVANARLIVAAPDLLAALRALVWQIDRDDSVVWEDGSPAAAMLLDARAAIAKATGGAS